MTGRGFWRVAVAAAALGCATPVEVQTTVAAGQDYRNLRTWAWLPVEQPARAETRADDPAMHHRIQAAIAEQLSRSRFQRQWRGVPDLYVTYHLEVDQQLETRTIDRSYYGSDWEFVTPTQEVSSYERGTLVIDISSAAEQKLIWRGVGRARLESNPRPGGSEKRIRSAVQQIMADFPPVLPTNTSPP